MSIQLKKNFHTPYPMDEAIRKLKEKGCTIHNFEYFQDETDFYISIENDKGVAWAYSDEYENVDDFVDGLYKKLYWG